MYLKLHTFSGVYGIYFYSTNAEVFSERTSLTLPLPCLKSCHTEDAGREDSIKQAETLTVMQGGEEKVALKQERQKGIKMNSWTVVGPEGKKKSISAGKSCLQKLIRLKSCNSI